MSSGCFYCRNHCDAKPPQAGPKPSAEGWTYTCRHGLDTSKVPEGPEGVLTCEKGDMQYGFQIGGYYRHMHFDGHPANEFNTCLEWHIEGDTEFPQGENLELHLCEWQQIEEWVKFWGKELRRRGWVVDDPKETEK